MARAIRAEAASKDALRVRFSPEERQLALRAAEVNRQTISGFIRDAVLSAAGDCLEDIQPPGPRQKP